jgi:hypothetical protein
MTAMRWRNVQGARKVPDMSRAGIREAHEHDKVKEEGLDSNQRMPNG